MGVNNKVEMEYEARAMISETQYESFKNLIINQEKKYLVNTNIYIDSDDLYLIHHHMVLRIRVIDEEAKELTLKVKGDNGDIEINESLSEDYYQSLLKEFTLKDGPIKEALIERNVDIGSFKIISSLKTERIEVTYPNFLFVLDKNYYRNIVDFNIEVESDSKENAIKYLNKIGEPLGVRYEKGYVSKSARATLGK